MTTLKRIGNVFRNKPDGFACQWQRRSKTCHKIHPWRVNGFIFSNHQVGLQSNTQCVTVSLEQLFYQILVVNVSPRESMLD